MPNKLLGNCKQGQLFVVSAPAGTGKTTLVQMLAHEFPCIVENISYTTRQPREGEIPDVHYHFVSKEEFQYKIREDHFLEHVSLYGDNYGSDRAEISAQLSRGKHVVLVIDTQGALQLKKKVPAIYIFIKPPSMEILRERMTQRKTETEEAIKKRLSWAQKEIELEKEYDYTVVNDDLNSAFEVLKSIFIAEEHRNR